MTAAEALARYEEKIRSLRAELAASEATVGALQDEIDRLRHNYGENRPAPADGPPEEWAVPVSLEPTARITSLGADAT